MTFAILSEIRVARVSLSKLNSLERRRLLRRIIDALDKLQYAPLTASAVPNWDAIDKSQALGEISTMADVDFRNFINEFDILVTKLG